MKRIKRGIFGILASISLISVVHAAPSYSMSLSATSIEQGSSVTATLTISGVAAWNVSLEGNGSTSGCSQRYADATSNGGNTTKYLTVTCRSTGIGQISFRATGDATSSDGKTSNISAVRVVTVTAPRQRDANNNLKSLSVKGYKLSPEFNADTLEYSVDVPNTVNKVTIEGEKASSYASITGTGEFEVSEGANAFSVIVTSETGNAKEYKINVNVKDENPIKLNISNSDYTIVKNVKKIEAPSTYEATTIKINDIEVPAFYSEVSNFTLVAIKNGKGDLSFAIYNKDNNSYTLYNENKSDQLLLYVMPMDKELEGFTKSTVKINDVNYDCIKKDDLVIIKAMNIVTGKEDYYIYDKELNSYVKYDTSLFDSYKDEITKYKQVLLYLGGGSIIVIFVLILIILHKPKRKKQINKKANEPKENIKINKIAKEEILKESSPKEKNSPEREITKEIDDATKIIDTFEKEPKKDHSNENDLEPTMYDIFSEDKKKKKKKRK